MEKLFKQDGDIKREYTEEEYAQHAIDFAEYEASIAAAEAAAEKAEADKAAAEAKLAVLGLTTDDLKALGLGNN
jgi:hypothetical protein